MMKNDDGTAGIITFIFLFLLAGILFVVLGFGIDRITLIANRALVDVAATQMRFDILTIQLIIF